MRPADLIIRQATTDDADALAGLHADALPPGWPASDFEKYARSAAAQIWCAYQDAALIGLCAVQALPPEAEILTAGVAKGARRAGVGQALLRHTIAQLRERGVSRIFLDVAEGNRPAQRLYETLGFKLFARRKNYYQTGGLLDDAMVMLLDCPA